MSDRADYLAVYDRFRDLATAGLPAHAFYAQVRAHGVTGIHAIALLRDYYELGLADSMAIHKSFSGYSNEDFSSEGVPDFPERGDYCPKCKVNIPSFVNLPPDLEREIRAITDSVVQMDRVQLATGCPRTWAKIWVNHPDGPEREFGHSNAPPCPECGKQLRTDKAKQCVECGADWH